MWVNLVLPVPITSPISKESTLKFQGLNSVHSNWTAIGLVNLRWCNHNPGCWGCGTKKVGSGWRFALQRMVELAAKAVGSWFAIVWYVQYPSIFLPHGCNSLSIFSTIEVTWGEISLSLMNRKASLLWSLILESHLYLMYDRRLSLFSVVRFVLIIHSHFQISSTCATVSQEVGTCLVKHHATKVGG